MPTPPSKRWSRQFDMSASALENSMSGSRPTSPLPSADLRRQRYPATAGYGSQPASSRFPTSPPESQGGRLVLTHTRNNSSKDGSLMAALPQNQDVIRVISTGGVTKVVKIADCNTCEEVKRVTLRKISLRAVFVWFFCFLF